MIFNEHERYDQMQFHGFFSSSITGLDKQKLSL